MILSELDVELYFGCLVGAFGSSELSFLVEAKETCQDVVWEHADHGVVFLDGFGVVLALDCNAIFASFVLALEVAEGLGGGEFGVAFDGELDGFLECVGEFVLGFLEFGDVLVGELIGIDDDGACLCAGLDYFGEGAFLVVGCTFDDGFEAGDEVGAALIYVFYLCPSFLDVFVLGDHFALSADGPKYYYCCYCDDGNGGFFHGVCVIRLFVGIDLIFRITKLLFFYCVGVIFLLASCGLVVLGVFLF